MATMYSLPAGVGVKDGTKDGRTLAIRESLPMQAFRVGDAWNSLSVFAALGAEGLAALEIYEFIEDSVPQFYIKGTRVDVLDGLIMRGTYPNAVLDEDAQYAALSSAASLSRDRLLASSDWTQTVDAPLTKDNKTEWQTYRQALRDITAQAEYPLTIVWPTAPAISSPTDLDFSANTDVISSVKTEKTIAATKKNIDAMEDGAQKTAMLAILTLLEGA